MFEWFNNFLLGLNKEAAGIIGAMMGAALIAVSAGLRGMKNGKTSKEPAGSLIAPVICTAPDLHRKLDEIDATNRTAISRQQELIEDVKDIRLDVARLIERVPHK